MTLQETKKLSSHIIRLLKLNEIIIPICRTSKGNLGIIFSASNDDFELMLDSVPLSTKDILQDENNIELKRMIEKYWFTSETFTEKALHPKTPIAIEIVENILETSIVKEKKRGRPAGSKKVK